MKYLSQSALMLSLVIGMAVMGATTPAEARKCRSSEQAVPKWGCVKKTEVRKARATCSKLKPPAKFTQCLCQDGSLIGACGA
jgi:hypothetical protein